MASGRKNETYSSDKRNLTFVESKAAEIVERSIGFNIDDPDLPLFETGVESISLLKIVTELNYFSTRNISFETLAANCSIRGIARLMSGHLNPVERECLTSFRNETDPRVQMLFSHAVGGTIMFYRELAQNLARRIQFLAFQARGLGDGENPLSSVKDMACLYHSDFLSSPYSHEVGPKIVIGGYSFGCFVASEIARIRLLRGERVDMCVLVAPPINGVSAGADNIRQEAMRLLAIAKKDFGQELPVALEERLLSVYEAHLLAQSSHTFVLPSCKVVIIVPEDDNGVYYESEQFISSIAQNDVTVSVCKGGHFDVLRGSNAKLVADVLNNIAVQLDPDIHVALR
jgi:surfactin synthase thioesterase subunit